MRDNGSSAATLTAGDVFVAAENAPASVPVWFVREQAGPLPDGASTPGARRWLEVNRFSGVPKRHMLMPDKSGGLRAVAFGLGCGRKGEPSGPSELLTGQLAQNLPPGGDYHLTDCENGELAAVAWGLGLYRFRRYKSATGEAPPRLVVPMGVDAAALVNTVEAVWFGRDLINTPASDMGPEELEAAARGLAARHGALVKSIVGDALLAENFPLIHAVGRASARPPRLIDLTWGRSGAPSVTLVGKGICFDTGGLDIKPASGMALMKKDMGGAATVLALGHMIMGQKLDVRLRILIPAAENSISGNAFRPGDVVVSRAGPSVEIGNTDAEGRLVLADALALADEDGPETLLVFATLTGAARVALGPDLPAFFTDDDAFAAAITATSERLGDPVWRLPFWNGYERHLESDVADMNNVFEAPFAGAITAALFLRRFVVRARRFAHFDIFGWRPVPHPLGPKGGEPQAARALFALLAGEKRL